MSFVFCRSIIRNTITNPNSIKSVYYFIDNFLICISNTNGIAFPIR